MDEIEEQYRKFALCADSIEQFKYFSNAFSEDDTRQSKYNISTIVIDRSGKPKILEENENA